MGKFISLGSAKRDAPIYSSGFSVNFRPPLYASDMVIPDNLEITDGFRGKNGIPSKISRSAKQIAEVEWVWSCANSRKDSYYISLDSTRTRWVFWQSYFHDSEAPWRWVCHDVSSAPRADISRKEAAAAMLQNYWRTNADER